VTSRDIAYIALGSNIGDRARFLEEARAAIGSLRGTRCLAETPVEETEPIGPVPQPPFLNQMLAVETDLAPEELLAELQAIENDAGRERNSRWGPRTLDLDIVALEGRAISSPLLRVPHPELPNREFWLRELALLRQSAGKAR
jgi:2-amino-4-hydroxy-6-hydroxymethyldihydropteridine pyrophosphokinase